MEKEVLIQQLLAVRRELNEVLGEMTKLELEKDKAGLKVLDLIKNERALCRKLQSEETCR